MNRKRSRSRQTSPRRGSPLILWLWIWGFVLIVALGIFTLLEKQDIGFSIIAFVLMALGIIFTFLQVAPNAPQQARQTLKEGLGLLGILLLVGSLVINGYLLTRSSPPSPIPNPSHDFPTPTSTALSSVTSSPVIACGKSINSPPNPQANIIVQTGCVGVLDANSGDVNNGQWHIGTDQGGLVALPPGHYSIIFTAGEIFFLPAAIANYQFCQRYHEDIAAGNALNKKNVWPLPGWHPC